MGKSGKNRVTDSFRQIATKLQGEGVGAVLARGASASFIIKVLGTGIAFGTQIFLARVMGAEQYGIYIYVLTWLYVLVLFAKMGWDTALLRYVAAYNAQGDWSALRGILQCSNQLALFTSILVSSSTALVIWILREKLGSELSYTFWIGCAVLPMLTLSGLRQAALRSLKHIVLAQLPEILLQPMMLCIFVGVVFTGFSQSVNSQITMCLNFCTLGISFVFGTYWLYNKLPEPVKIVSPQYKIYNWVSVALPLLLVSSVYIIMNRLDVLMIGIFSGTTDAGIYSVASKISTLITFSLTVVSTIAAPMISELYSQDKLRKLQELVTSISWINIMFSIPIFLGIFIFGKRILAIFGLTYTDGYLALCILGLAQLFNALTGPIGHLMTMTAYQNKLVQILFLFLLINLILNYVLIPKQGIIGAALATAIANLGWNFVAAFFVYKRIGINAISIFELKPILKHLIGK